MLRHLEACEVAGAKRFQFFGADLRIGLEADEGGDRLSIYRIGLSDDGGLSHGWMAVEHLFDLARRNVFAAANNQIILAVDDVAVAVGIHIADVASVKPSAGESACSFLR